MTSANASGRAIAGVVDTLRQARHALVDPSPGNIDFCRIAVTQSVQQVVNAMQSDRSVWNQNELKNLLIGVRRELNAIDCLLNSAAAFRRNMLKAAPAVAGPPVADNGAAATQTVRHVHVFG